MLNQFLPKTLGILSLKEKIKSQLSALSRLAEQVGHIEDKISILETLKEQLETLNQQLAALEVLEAQADAFYSEIPSLEEQIQEISQSTERSAQLVNQVVDTALKNNHKSVFWGDRLLSLDKSMGFWQDPKFQEAYAQIVGSHYYDQYNRPDGIAWRINTLVWAAKTALNLPGDFVECGVFKGDMSWVVANCVDFAKVEKTFYLYDTFAGFSSKYSSPDDFWLSPSLFDLNNKFYNIPDLEKEVRQRFKDYPNIKVIKGVVPDILSETAPSQIAYLHVDLNSPGPEIGALECLFERVVSGGVIVFDDYGWLDFQKLKIAEDNWMNERGYSILELPTGQGMVIKR